MKLSELTYGIRNMVILGSIDPDISGLAIDSRKVKKGFLFVALRGTVSDGHKFISGAISSGAQAILCAELPEYQDKNIAYLLCDDSSLVLGEICKNFYDDPSSNLNIIAITGTNGKTSIATWLYELCRTLGYPSGLISTIRVVIKDKSYPATHTTPDIISLYEHLNTMVDAGCEYVFMEVSSHALDQGRTAGLEFSGAVFTNISRDHLDYHKDFKSYILAKKKLFDVLHKGSFALVNADDRNSGIMLQNSVARHIKYSTTTISDYQGKLIEQINQGMMLQINGQELWVPFIGRFNASNLTAVYGVAVELGWNREEVLTGISAMKQVDGRFEKVDLGDNITGIVDYAHTPDALKNVLQTIKEMCTPHQRVITVVGAGGDRDRGKRPEMAGVACAYSEIVVLTSDNPRSEDPDEIIEEMKKGIPDEMESQVFSLTNRHEAIKLAFALSKPGDFVLIAGKGHETYQEIKGIKHHFDDKEELLSIKSTNHSSKE